MYIEILRKSKKKTKKKYTQDELEEERISEEALIFFLQFKLSKVINTSIIP